MIKFELSFLKLLLHLPLVITDNKLLHALHTHFFNIHFFFNEEWKHALSKLAFMQAERMFFSVEFELRFRSWA